MSLKVWCWISNRRVLILGDDRGDCEFWLRNLFYYQGHHLHTNQFHLKEGIVEGLF